VGLDVLLRGPGTYLTTPALVISTGLTIFIGTAGLPHILMRFFTVPDAKARGWTGLGAEGGPKRGRRRRRAQTAVRTREPVA
jgi:hypothetical protein